MRVDRLLSIILIMLNKGNVTGQELAHHFEVSLRTIYRDIDKLCEAGVPIASVGGKGGGYYIMDDYDIKKLFFSKEEVGSLIPLISSLGNLMGKNQSFNDIVHKLEKVNENPGDHRLKIDLSHFSLREELKEYMAEASRAIEESRELIFHYINRNKEYSQRVVEPIQITLSHGEWYLVCFCKNRGDYRRFKFVRIRNLSLGEPYVKKEITQQQLDDIFAASYSKRSIVVKLKFDGSIGEQLPEYFAKASIAKEEESYIVTEEYPHEEGLLKFILGFGNDCEVLEPQFFRDEVREYIKKMFAAYNR